MNDRLLFLMTTAPIIIQALSLSLSISVLLSAMKRAGIATSDQAIHWPLITKQGTNDYGKKVHFYFNYSSKTGTVMYDHPAGNELTSNHPIKKGDKLAIAAWDVQIVEEN